MKKFICLAAATALMMTFIGCDLFEVECKAKVTEHDIVIKNDNSGSYQTAYYIDLVESSDTSVVKVSRSGSDKSGVVTLTSKGKGDATITFYSGTHAKKAVCEVSINAFGDWEYEGTVNLSKLQYLSYENSLTMTSKSSWKDNQGTVNPEIDGMYKKANNSEYRLYIKGDIVYCFNNCALETDTTWFWVRGIIEQQDTGKIYKIDWNTCGKLRLDGDNSIWFGENVWSGTQQGWGIFDGLDTATNFAYSIEDDYTVKINGYAYTKYGNKP
ncbi:MAG: hypothetical protein IKP67_06295 [Spirochaetales bacterium]|nr:hypothetical protein [Spirochaetales bacterium]